MLSVARKYHPGNGSATATPGKPGKRGCNIQWEVWPDYSGEMRGSWTVTIAGDAEMLCAMKPAHNLWASPIPRISPLNLSRPKLSSPSLRAISPVNPSVPRLYPPNLSPYKPLDRAPIPVQFSHGQPNRGPMPRSGSSTMHCWVLEAGKQTEETQTGRLTGLLLTRPLKSKLNRSIALNPFPRPDPSAVFARAPHRGPTADWNAWNLLA
jgi:hypothetical protein